MANPLAALTGRGVFSVFSGTVHAAGASSAAQDHIEELVCTGRSGRVWMAAVAPQSRRGLHFLPSREMLMTESQREPLRDQSR